MAQGGWKGGGSRAQNPAEDLLRGADSDFGDEGHGVRIIMAHTDTLAVGRKGWLEPDRPWRSLVETLNLDEEEPGRREEFGPRWKGSCCS